MPSRTPQYAGTSSDAHSHPRPVAVPARSRARRRPRDLRRRLRPQQREPRKERTQPGSTPGQPRSDRPSCRPRSRCAGRRPPMRTFGRHAASTPALKITIARMPAACRGLHAQPGTRRISGVDAGEHHQQRDAVNACTPSVRTTVSRRSAMQVDDGRRKGTAARPRYDQRRADHLRAEEESTRLNPTGSGA